ncbi:MAG TPA: crotonase/enoyl-CoA hydratase family protein [Leptospiraceae bacterium]|nr:crotonase/enoyl-CoA hydratase family protein [Leptospiraceae bacterium]HMX34761.1 crotonase/enoyl-CoA hydratase family protein [Leptospiraceae bacterium]HMY30422.1 crotonase/enoyl-CoA hydratase family protein [Leptospiraceae bacterium]HMZ64656.1 crotonase/enoyl-CoA hydratase family protein [Leptospiraceae bacterium]HNA09367.1 crotonase/enoyl-CoA hydratase family protein [Leptospiraceae bacterium]
MKTKFEFFEIEIEDHIAIVYLNKPEKRNAMDWSFWRDLPEVVEEINKDETIRAFIIAARGKSFSTGLDVLSFTSQVEEFLVPNNADTRKRFYNHIQVMQSGINAVYNSNKPSIAVVQKHCIGGALDLISACDIRYCTTDASFSLREVKVAIVADMGSINRLPAIIGQGYTRELALTGRDVSAEEASKMNLVNGVYPTLEEAMKKAKDVAKDIASSSTLVVEGVKEVMRFSEGKPMEAGLNYVCVWNSSFLASSDFDAARKAFATKTKPVYNENKK